MKTLVKEFLHDVKENKESYFEIMSKGVIEREHGEVEYHVEDKHVRTSLVFVECVLRYCYGIST
jgi:hypothetical protein